MSVRRFRVRHRTAYHYGEAMTDGYTVAYVTPRPTREQRVLSASVSVTPTATEADSYDDLFGNRVHQFGVHEPHDHLEVIVTAEVELSPTELPVDTTRWEDVVSTLAARRGPDAFSLGFLRGPSALVPPLQNPLIEELTGAAFSPGRPIIESLHALNQAIFEGFVFDPTFSTVSTPLDEVLVARRGVCQDFAHLAIVCARSVGLSARYVSGYLETIPPPGTPRLVGADASHAWCSVWTPAAGWVDLDPTNGHLPVNDHITVGWGRDYGDVTPVRGVMIGPATTQHLEVGVDVERIDLS